MHPSKGISDANLVLHFAYNFSSIFFLSFFLSFSYCAIFLFFWFSCYVTLFNTVTAFRHEMCLILGTFRLMRINRTASLMISIKNGDLNPFLRWSPLGRCARIMKPSLFLCWVSLRSKLHARTHTHTHFAHSRLSGLREWMCRSKSYEGFGRSDEFPHLNHVTLDWRIIWY